MLSTYTKIMLGISDGVIKHKAGSFLIELLKKYMRIEKDRHFPINWQLRYLEFMNIYKMFEIDGYINYEVNKKE